MNEPKQVTLEGFIVTGISVVTNNHQETTPQARIPGLWQQFSQDYADTSASFGVYSNYVSDETGDYQILTGNQSLNANQAQELQEVTICAGDYLVFSAKGPMPQTVIALWQHIWQYFKVNTHLKRAFQTDFERYEAKDNITIYIGLI